MIGTDEPTIGALTAATYRVPTAGPEADGTLEWDATTIVVVRAQVGDVAGLGWTYSAPACADVVRDVLAEIVVGRPAGDPAACWHAMQRGIRNLGRPGIVSCALSAVDMALWDAAARLLPVPLPRLLGRVRDSVPLYASGGFTTWDDDRLARWVHDWTTERAVPRIKVKIAESWGGFERRDLARVALTRRYAGDEAEVYTDANGGYSVGQACRVGEHLADWAVTWFEEPVSSDDLTGLRRVREAVSADVTAGEYGYDLASFTRLVGARAVDCVQVDVTRCGGYTEWARIAALAAAHNLEVSAHCAPNASAHAAMATPNFRHIEWFTDHHRVEELLFDGALDPTGGTVTPVPSAPGHGLALKESDADRYRI